MLNVQAHKFWRRFSEGVIMLWQFEPQAMIELYILGTGSS